MTASAVTDPCGANGNKISCENSKPGSPRSEWNLGGPGDDDIQGFSTNISVNVGAKMDFKIDTSARAYTIGIYRLGYYNGDGARKVDTISPSASLPQAQPQCITDAATELYDCGNWGVSASWNVPSTAVSGVYEALLTRTDNRDQSAITFVVRDDSSHSDVVFQTSDPTWQAYNTYGGSDFYLGGDNGRSYKLSYNRPILTRGGVGGRDFFFANEYPAVEFLEKNGYDVSYISGVDSDRYGSLLLNHKTFMSVGHDEYWSKGQRANVENARDHGVNLMFLSGNEVYWKTRYEPSADASHTDYRTLVSYKETWANAKIDPSDEWTGTWRDPRFAPKAKGGGVPENGLTGTMFMSNTDDIAMQVSAAQGKNRLWRNTSVASLAAGTKATLAPHTIGYESDEDVDNGSRPAGLIDLTTTTGDTPQYLTDFGNTVVPGTTTHSMTMYRAPSGALVFGAGTIQWTWGLDTNHDSPYAAVAADVRMQQFQVNLLAEMSAQPTTLATGLVTATKSTDTTGPTATISSPASGSTQTNGSNVTVTGTATDNGGGVVAGVEVSTDGGSTWHPATGTSSWTYTYVQHGVGSTPIQVRATDDSANIGGVVARSVTVTCPCSIFGAAVPTTPTSSDTGPVELGLRFSPTTDGFVTGVRFYKGSGNSGTHTGTLWGNTGAKLASVTFTNETASGWQTATFSSPVAVSSGSTYVVSYTAPNGHYAAVVDAFSSAATVATPLTVDGGFGATPAGVYADSGVFPNSSYQNTNYGVDALFTTTDAAPLAASNQWPLPDSSSVPANTTVSAQFSKALVAGSQGLSLKDVNGNTVTGTTAYNTSTRTITFTPSSALNGFVKYTATLAGADAQGNQVTTGKTWSFTTAKPGNAPGVCPCSIFDDNTVPTTLEANDNQAVTLGVRFTSDTAGTVTGVRFYKGLNNTGTHIGALWSATGTKLATGTFTGESTTGWQTLTFSQPVTITKDTQYVASYRTTVGKYSVTPDAFAGADLSRVPLHVTSSSGAYSYADTFPSAASASSYLVDLTFEKGAAQIAVASQDPADGATQVPRGTSIATTFTAAINASGYTEMVTQVSSGDPIAGTTSLSADGTKLTFTPSDLLPTDADINVVLTGVTSAEGATLPTQTWTFHTKSADAPDSQSLFSDEVPTVTAENDAAAVELGTVFEPDVDGTVTAIRFYKGAGNGGTHTGSIWSASGTRLTTVTFTNESSSGWQTATLATPLAVSAGTQYVVSYLAPQGHYASTGGFFASAWVKGDLTAPAGDNGRYLYGTDGGYPAYTYGATNYFIDVVFEASGPGINVTGRSPVSGATDVGRDSTISETFSTPIMSSGYSMTAKAGGTTVDGTLTLSPDQKTLTFTPTSELPADADVTTTVSGVVSTSGAALAADSWTFHTAAAVGGQTSLFATQTPATTEVNDSVASERGVAFTPSVNGSVTAIKFYKGAGNKGTHTGSVWNSSGKRLRKVRFTGETATGWQTATLANPVALTAGQTYVVSYYAPKGRYSSTESFFTAPWTQGPLTAPASDNGRYLTGNGGGFPTSSDGAANYFVDLVFSS